MIKHLKQFCNVKKNGKRVFRATLTFRKFRFVVVAVLVFGADKSEIYSFGIKICSSDSFNILINVMFTGLSKMVSCSNQSAFGTDGNVVMFNCKHFVGSSVVVPPFLYFLFHYVSLNTDFYHVINN